MTQTQLSEEKHAHTHETKTVKSSRISQPFSTVSSCTVYHIVAADARVSWKVCIILLCRGGVGDKSIKRFANKLIGARPQHVCMYVCMHGKLRTSKSQRWSLKAFCAEWRMIVPPLKFDIVMVWFSLFSKRSLPNGFINGSHGHGWVETVYLS